MSPLKIKVRRRDLRFLALVAANTVGIVGFIAAGLHAPEDTPGGWRRIDLGALKARIEAGDLARKEARWYRVAPEDERRGR